ncbi:hypothetical protein, partial [Pseudomonas aeruginosa]|uniref:hypothetical protein n=1 Tax=Pseudomonas aeruginosa TaxID=287 RepID=UPI00396AAB79
SAGDVDHNLDGLNTVFTYSIQSGGSMPEVADEMLAMPRYRELLATRKRGNSHGEYDSPTEPD